MPELQETEASTPYNSPRRTMDDPRGSGDYEKNLGIDSPRDTIIQIVFSLILGLGAFIAFCVHPHLIKFLCIQLTSLQILRPRWTGLYAARKKQRDEALPLPELPTTLFGWIPALWRINEQQVLASAGLDAYVVHDHLWSLFLLCAHS